MPHLRVRNFGGQALDSPRQRVDRSRVARSKRFTIGATRRLRALRVCGGGGSGAASTTRIVAIFDEIGELVEAAEEPQILKMTPPLAGLPLGDRLLIGGGGVAVCVGFARKLGTSWRVAAAPAAVRCCRRNDRLRASLAGWRCAGAR